MNNNTEKEKGEALQLYKEVYGEAQSIMRLPGAGSDRRYYRITGSDNHSVIATCGDDPKENLTFYNLAVAFKEWGCAVPVVYAINRDMTVYLQEDLGDVQLLDLLSTGRRIELSARTLKALVDLQTAPDEVWSPYVAWADFSRRLVMWDLNYFKYEFLKPTGIMFDENLLEDDFEALAVALCEGNKLLQGFMYRDFQSRNIMIKEGAPRFIDFQGGRKGPMIYDAVSFLWQAKAGFSAEERKELLQLYAELVAEQRRVEVGEILREVDKFALFRTLQVLGAYGFRGLVEKKSHFIESIPGALANLGELVEKGALSAYPELEKIAVACVSSRFASGGNKDGLTVKVFSFSYKKGYPEDLTGNGGGFMFDCRGMHNPGRYDRYKPLTGLDKEVKDFLEEKGEVQGFIKAALDMVTPVIERYRSRGFNSLQVGFGCTGGRHRSVYCAQDFAEQVSRRFPDVRVELIHREQGFHTLYN
ncbi:MAG: phosphotransferase [Muribaculaceae bacterium]|nr:phosphotransferase [Muribaculaceae bacterium]